MNSADNLTTLALADKLAALAHPARLSIVQYLAETECSCCKDVVGSLDLAQSTVSQHLKVLVAAGLVRMENERQRSLYSVDRTALAQLGVAMTDLMRDCCADKRCSGSDER
ncbi:MAG TPA: metalloregulator ArsR/SmtB family transcription factor [Rhizobiaceae bacterium]|nr:metalloregulator ArsR/SmtB family transcription factor [Rhizobiaceae bacterium]